MIDAGQLPAYVADQLDLSLASVYEAPSYYHDHIEQLCDIGQENEDTFERFRESSLKPRETLQ